MKKTDTKVERMKPHLGKKRIGKLNSATDVAKYIARVIRRTERGGEGVDPNETYKLVMMASMLLKPIEAGLLEARINKLEQMVNDKIVVLQSKSSKP